MKQKKRNGQGGFTLVELIVVLAILGILGLIAVPKFSGFQDSAKKKADAETMAVLQNAVLIGLSDGQLKGTGDIVIKSGSDGKTKKLIIAESTGITAVSISSDGTETSATVDAVLENLVNSKVTIQQKGVEAILITVDANQNVTAALKMTSPSPTV